MMDGRCGVLDFSLKRRDVPSDVELLSSTPAFVA